MVMNQTPTTRFVFRARTTWGRPTTRILESSVAMKMPTVVTVRTTHLYSKNKPPDGKAPRGSTQRGIKRPFQREARDYLAHIQRHDYLAQKRPENDSVRVVRFSNDSPASN